MMFVDLAKDIGKDINKDVGSKANAEIAKESSWKGLVLLFLIVGLFLGVESQAAITTGKDVGISSQTTMGPGSIIEFMDDFDFGLSREKRFCDGQDSGFFRSLLSTNCCTVRINPLDAPLTLQLVIAKGLRKIKDVSQVQKFALIDGKYEIIMNCGDQAPTSELLQKSMGNRIQIHSVKALPVVEPKPAVNSEPEVMTESISQPQPIEQVEAKTLEVTSSLSLDTLDTESSGSKNLERPASLTETI